LRRALTSSTVGNGLATIGAAVLAEAVASPLMFRDGQYSYTSQK